jgi:aminoglycoside 2'-N-acetyltransferase I
VLRAAASVIAEGYELGALSATVPDLYARLGWERWRGPTYVGVPGGRLRTAEDDDGVMVLRTAHTPDLDVTADLTCDWRRGDVW